MTTTNTAATTPDCNHCRRRPAAPDRTRCRPCLDKAAANSRKRYARLAAKAACTRCGLCVVPHNPHDVEFMVMLTAR